MMDVETGNPDYPIWLIGNSNPSRCETHLEGPLDPRHPVRHNIWTSVLDAMQDHIFRAAHLRVDTSCIYVRNAVTDAHRRPDHADAEWNPDLDAAVNNLRFLIESHRPIILCCFGAFAFEFVRRAVGEQVLYPVDHWTTRRLGEQFRQRIEHFEPGEANALPLLHAVIARGKFLSAHDQFCDRKGANYFEIVGATLAQTLLRYRDQLPVWIESRESVEM